MIDLIWTLLPTGFDGTRLFFSVHVAPRLTPASSPGTLSEFPLFDPWPPVDLELAIQFDGGVPERGVITSTPEPATWSRMFPGTSPVNGHQVVDRSALPIHTYPMEKIVQFLQDQYIDVAINDPEDFPLITDLLAAGWEDIDFSGRIGADRFNTALSALQAALAGPGVVDTTVFSDTGFDFVQLLDFFAPVDVSDPGDEAEFLEPVDLPRVDFHDAVQFCNQHPPLLRRLGLVFDVVFDTSLSPPPAGPTKARILPISASFGGVTNKRPWTHCEVLAADFVAVPSPGGAHIADGFLRLDDTGQFQTVPVDAQGGALKAVDLAGNLGRNRSHPTIGTPDRSPLPTLRADGFMVARVANAKKLKNRLALGVGHEADLGATPEADGLELYAEDLVRGYRVDVHDSRTAQWHSVMHRSGQYAFDGGATIVPFVDEGILTTAAAKKPLADDLYQGEALFWWDGWSLVAPRPGMTLNIDPQGSPLIPQPPNTPGGDFDASFTWGVVPGTLPTLRYGETYRFRARLVDLAGNSLPPDSTDDSHATPPLVFARFEPPQTPPVVMREPRGPGESVETIVVRSNFDTASTDPAERHIVPAKVGQLMAEMHGLVDVVDPGDPAQIVLDKAAYSVLAARDQASLLDHPAASIDPNDPEGTRFYDVDHLDVFHTPDPVARTFALRFLGGPNAGVLDKYPLLDPGDDWPDFSAVRLVAKEGAGLPSYDNVDRILTVPLEKADYFTVRLSAVLDVAELTDFGLWHWILTTATAAQKDALELLVKDGQHWMFEPYRILTFIHAVRQPLAVPDFPVTPIPNRGLGNTFTLLTGKLSFSRKSTSKVDVLASWEDPVDEGPGTVPPADVGDPGSRVVVDQTAFTLEVDHDDTPDHEIDIDRIRHELGDTKTHMVTYRAVATTRFGEFFTERDEIAYPGPGGAVVLATGGLGLVPGSVKVTHTLDDGTPLPLSEDEHFTVDETLGQVTFDPGLVLPDLDPGDLLVFVYLVPPVTRETPDPPAAGEFGPQMVTIPSSARPASVRLVYALPTFGWAAADLLDGPDVIGKTSTRHGAGIRLYMERPWWSSGKGELLGVVVMPAGRGLPDVAEEDPRRPYVTQWGEDPIYGSEPLPALVPLTGHFPAAVATDSELTLAELDSDPGAPVSVAAHGVGFDPVRDLWFCDIAVAPDKAYMPFIRLALARYQSESIPNTHLSRVVLADFIQLTPGRLATVLFDPGDDRMMRVSLAGPSHRSTEASGGLHPGTARIFIEERDTSVPDPVLGWKPRGFVGMTGNLVGDEALWTASVTLPGPRVPGKWRLVIEQYERMGAEPKKKRFFDTGRTKPIKVERLVHTDIIPL